MKRVFGLGAVVLGLLALGGCSRSDGNSSTGTPRWSYSGEDGPAQWATLDPNWAVCADGLEQSPIALRNAAAAALVDPVIAYKAGMAAAVNNGHSIEVEANDSGSLTVDGIEYPLAFMSFHAPAEHTINGETFPIEVQLGHKTPEGELAMLGIMVKQGVAENPAWDPYVSSLGTAVGATTEINVDWAAMLPASLKTYRYKGSLTTPGCAEGVEWMVLQTPVELSARQIAAFQAAYSNNARPLQPLNGRVIEVDNTVG